MIERIKMALRAHGDKLLFLMIGAVNTVFSLGLYTLFVLVIDRLVTAGVLPLMPQWLQADVAAFAAWLISVTFSWGMFKLFVFKTRGTNWLAEWGRSYLVYLPSFIANLGALSALIGLLHVNKIVAQIMWSVIMAVYSWFAHKWFTFGSPREDEPEPTTWEES